MSRTRGEKTTTPNMVSYRAAGIAAAVLLLFAILFYENVEVAPTPVVTPYEAPHVMAQRHDDTLTSPAPLSATTTPLTVTDPLPPPIPSNNHHWDDVLLVCVCVCVGCTTLPAGTTSTRTPPASITTLVWPRTAGLVLSRSQGLSPSPPGICAVARAHY